MSRLALTFLGPFGAALDDQPIHGFESNKVRALLAYLAVESGNPHRRETLAGLFWPEMPDRLALSNLRYALSNLRGAIGDREAQPSFLLVSRDSIQFNTGSDHTLDTAIFLDAVASHDVFPEESAPLAAALSLYRGAFLEGFSVGGSPAFEEWALIRREQIGRQAMSAFRALANDAEDRREFVLASTYARRQIEMEPWDEEGHRQLMRSLALSGQRNAALHQFSVCRRLLAKELGVEPADETTALYRSIRTTARLSPPTPPIKSRAAPAWELGGAEEQGAQDFSGADLPRSKPDGSGEVSLAGPAAIPATASFAPQSSALSPARPNWALRIAFVVVLIWAVIATVAAASLWLSLLPG